MAVCGSLLDDASDDLQSLVNPNGYGAPTTDQILADAQSSGSPVLALTTTVEGLNIPFFDFVPVCVVSGATLTDAVVIDPNPRRPRLLERDHHGARHRGVRRRHPGGVPGEAGPVTRLLRRRRGQDGAVAAEFALLVPLAFLLIGFGIALGLRVAVRRDHRVRRPRRRPVRQRSSVSGAYADPARSRPGPRAR